MFSVRLLENSDYVTLVGWWKTNRFPPPGINDLPLFEGEMQGVMVFQGAVEICAGFLIDTSVPNAAMIEYIVANFEVKDRKFRKKALILLINSLKNLAKSMGKKYVFTSVKNKNLIDKLTAAGFVVGSAHTTEMIAGV